MAPKEKPKPSEVAVELAAVIRGYMARYGINQKDMAESAKTTQSQLSKILRGERHLDVDQLIHIADRLDLNVADLLNEAFEGVIKRKNKSKS